MCTLLVVARQRHGIHVPAATNTQNKQGIAGTSFSVRSVSYQRIVYGSVYPPIVARQWLPWKRQILETSFFNAVLVSQRTAGDFISQNPQSLRLHGAEWKGVVVGLIVVLSRRLLQGTEENCENPVLSRLRFEPSTS
jgi:hypothetical protein